MNRRLDNTLIALAASSLALSAIALFAAPDMPSGAMGAGRAVHASSNEAPPPGGDRPLLNRRGLAMPYFSFARGVRRIGG
ncbi:MAG TPA: hypothetical protein VIG97_01555 [Luteimonas sp.]